MPTALTGQWALILGVSSGMGRATAQALGRAGLNIAGVHFDLAAAEPAIEALTALTLAGSDSSWLTGNVIGVDGGEVLTT
jgi:NAD(P)-dependent dehydrogenase (short-subunit alcohol dehydrogenase family)